MAKTREALGDEHIHVAMWSMNLADCLRQMGEFAQAKDVLEPAFTCSGSRTSTLPGGREKTLRTNPSPEPEP